ncbi:MAG: D-glycerate dehydrogenase [Pseudomonadota bacterium]
MSKPRAIVTRRWPESVEQQLGEIFDVDLNGEDDKPLSQDQLKAAFQDYDAVLATVSDKVNAEVLSAEPMKARLIGNFGVGFNHIDLEAAKARGLTVTNTPDVLTDATADLAMTLLLAIARRAGEGERHVRGNAWTGWRPTHMMGSQVTGKTLGVIGFGRIGRAVAKRAHHGFDMSVLFHDEYDPPEGTAQAVGAQRCATIEDLMERSDFISLHCPGGEATYHLINEERLTRVKPGAYLINTARGDVIHEAALVAALKDGRLAGAGLDVYEKEPKVTPELAAMENVVLLPHLGSATHETRVAMGMKVIDNAKAFFNGEEPPNRVV